MAFSSSVFRSCSVRCAASSSALDKNDCGWRTCLGRAWRLCFRWRRFSLPCGWDLLVIFNDDLANIMILEYKWIPGYFVLCPVLYDRDNSFSNKRSWIRFRDHDWDLDVAVFYGIAQASINIRIRYNYFRNHKAIIYFITYVPKKGFASFSRLNSCKSCDLSRCWSS